MTGGQVAVGLGAAALVVANQVTHRPLMLGKVLGNLPGNMKVAETQWSELVFEAIGAIVLVVVAGLGDGGAKIAGVVLVTLWILFFITMKAGTKSAATSPSQKPTGVLA